MKAFRRFAREERAARLVELPVPEPAENQVLLRVSHCGICGSDLHAWLNHKGYESVLPEVTFGHELSGTVEKVGDKAKVWNVGDHAIMIALQTPHDPNDRYCRESLPQLSSRRRVQGLHLDGGMAEYVCVDQEFLIPVPEGLPLKLAALTEPLSVAEHCIENRSAIGEGSNVVVSGPGIIGLLCAISARSRGANVLLSGTERDEPTRLRAAREIGFETLVVGPITFTNRFSIFSLMSRCSRGSIRFELGFVRIMELFAERELHCRCTLFAGDELTAGSFASRSTRASVMHHRKTTISRLSDYCRRVCRFRRPSEYPFEVR